jgi:hypothetical protein
MDYGNRSTEEVGAFVNGRQELLLSGINDCAGQGVTTNRGQLWLAVILGDHHRLGEHTPVQGHTVRFGPPSQTPFDREKHTT